MRDRFEEAPVVAEVVATVKVEFLQNAGGRDKGDVAEVPAPYAEELIAAGQAKAV